MGLLWPRGGTGLAGVVVALLGIAAYDRSCLGVVLAHDRGVAVPARGSRTSQYPLLAVRVAFTLGGLALLLG